MWLTVFRRYSHSRLQKLEWTYVAACYGLPGILAIVFLFISTEARGRLYGSLVVSDAIDNQNSQLVDVFFFFRFGAGSVTLGI